MFKKKDSFLFLLAAFVVIVSSFLVITRHLAAEEIQARVEGAKTYRRDTADELMRLLRQTFNDGGVGEVKRLKNDASGF